MSIISLYVLPSIGDYFGRRLIKFKWASLESGHNKSTNILTSATPPFVPNCHPGTVD